MQNLLMLAKMDESSTKLPMCEFDISTAAERYRRRIYRACRPQRHND
ncbi:MAG: hypothetical protein ACLS48_09140 [[Eubacterium] siraeum]